MVVTDNNRLEGPEKGPDFTTNEKKTSKKVSILVPSEFIGIVRMEVEEGIQGVNSSH